MFNKNNFAERLSLLLDQHCISKQLLANNVNTSRTTISKIAHGANLPSIELLVSIAQYFDVSVDYLLGITDNPKKTK